jgi:magnesium-transporting ATPase (P-type)
VNEVNLNGETALKLRKALLINHEVLTGSIQIPLPNKDAQKLDDTFTFEEVHGLTIKNCIRRGNFPCYIKCLIRIALYTGHNTHIMQNQRSPPHKTSHLDSKLNKIIAFDFILNFILMIFMSISAKPAKKSFHFIWIEKEGATFITFGQYFCSHAAIPSYMIYVSLHVSLMFIRFFQTLTFEKDLAMYHREFGYCGTHNSNLNEELGFVDHVFSDTTETLTENIMNFVQASSRGQIIDFSTLKLEDPEIISFLESNTFLRIS